MQNLVGRTYILKITCTITNFISIFQIDDNDNLRPSWIMTTRGPHETIVKNYNITSRRKQDRKKDREKDRGKERDSDRESNNQPKKNINIGPSRNIQYEDIDYSQINNYNTNNNYNTHYNVENANRNIDRKTEDISSKNPKGFVLNKPFGAWPFHTNKEINTYYTNKTEPKYYLGMNENEFGLTIVLLP